MAEEIEGVTQFRAAAREISTVVVANRNEIGRVGIEALLHANGYSVVARCSHEYDLLRFAEAYRPNIILMADNIAPQEEAGKTVLRLRAGNCSVMIIFLLEEGHAITPADLLDLGAEGVLLSAACGRSIIECFESVRHGRKWVDPDLLRHLAMTEQRPQVASALTSREAEVAHLVSQGLQNKEIARELHVSEGTVKMHLHHIYQKLHLRRRTQLVLSTAGALARMVLGALDLVPCL
jgi:DNA-binding NarL/FixJ family response regulator